MVRVSGIERIVGLSGFPPYVANDRDEERRVGLQHERRAAQHAEEAEVGAEVDGGLEKQILIAVGLKQLVFVPLEELVADVPGVLSGQVGAFEGERHFG